MSSNDDMKLRQLTERLVAMSPEPPPYPEDVPLTAPSPRVRRLNPVLIFSGAAALVVIAAAIPILLFGGGTGTDPAVTVPPNIVGTTVPTDTTIPTTSPNTSDPAPPMMEIRETMVFFVTDPAESVTGNPTMVPFHTTVNLEESSEMEQVTAATLQLLANPDATAEPPAGFYNAVPQGVEVYDVTLVDGTLHIEVSENFADGAGGLLADVTMLNQIIYTATWWSPDMKVVFTTDGQVVETFGTEGIVIDAGIGREDFLDELGLIVITAPFILGGDELPQVVGVANVFEATVSLRIVWAESGELVYEDFTTATCGTGCWGEFGFSLDIVGLEQGQLVQVFWNSPEDGRMLDVVTYSVGAAGEAWNFFPDPDQ